MLTKAIYFGLLLLAVIAMTAMIFRLFNPNRTLPTRTITVNQTKLTVEIANTEIERKQGLSGRKSLVKSHGLLFIFDEPGLYPFWMKDMRFPIDILWLDENFNVVDAWLNASPDSYPQQVTPSHPAKYVLETNPGEIKTELSTYPL